MGVKSDVRAAVVSHSLGCQTEAEGKGEGQSARRGAMGAVCNREAAAAEQADVQASHAYRFPPASGQFAVPVSSARFRPN